MQRCRDHPSRSRIQEEEVATCQGSTFPSCSPQHLKQSWHKCLDPLVTNPRRCSHFHTLPNISPVLGTRYSWVTYLWLTAKKLYRHHQLSTTHKHIFTYIHLWGKHTISLKVPAAAFFFNVSTQSSAYRLGVVGIPVAVTHPLVRPWRPWKIYDKIIKARYRNKNNHPFKRSPVLNMFSSQGENSVLWIFTYWLPRRAGLKFSGRSQLYLQGTSYISTWQFSNQSQIWWTKLKSSISSCS